MPNFDEVNEFENVERSDSARLIREHLHEAAINTANTGVNFGITQAQTGQYPHISTSGYTITNAFSGFDSIDEEVTPPERNSKPITAAHEMRLTNATQKVLNEFRVSHPYDPALDTRERNYEQMLRSEKNTNIGSYEYISSDIPVYAGNLSMDILMDIVRKRSCGDMELTDKGRLKIYCNKCGLDVPPQYAFLLNSHSYCSEHVPNLKLCTGCNSLKEDTVVIHTYDDRDINICIRCVMNRQQRGCELCAHAIPERNILARRCDAHMDHNGDSTSRSFSRGLKWVNTEKGDVVKSKRMFSAEIETLVKRSSLIELVANAIPRECGIGYDGSVTGEDLSGFEMQTPRLGGKKGEELVYRIAAELKKVEATVNDTCGLHVHLDGKGLISANRMEYPDALIKMWKTYIIFEDVILSLIPYNRRFSTYSRPLRDAFKIVDLDTCDTILDLERLWYKERHWQSIQSIKSQHHHSSRYFGVNLHPLLGHGHMEIRYHSGTTNANKILQWANLHALIMDAAVAKKFTTKFLKEGQHLSSLKEKTQFLFTTIGMAEASKQYFYKRQKKFTSKTGNESHVD